MTGENKEIIADAMGAPVVPLAGLTRREMRELERKQAAASETFDSSQLAAPPLSKEKPGVETHLAEELVLPEISTEVKSDIPELPRRRDMRGTVTEEKPIFQNPATVEAPVIEIASEPVSQISSASSDAENVNEPNQQEIASSPVAASSSKRTPAIMRKARETSRTRPQIPIRKLSITSAKSNIKSTLRKASTLRGRNVARKLFTGAVIAVCFAFALSVSIPANALLTQSDIEQIKMQAFLDNQVSLANQTVIVSDENNATNLASRDGVDVTLATKPVQAAFYGSSGLCGAETDVNAPATGGPILWPLANNKISSPYGYRWGSLHAGIDFEGPTGTPVMSVSDGVVKAAFPSAGNSLGICAIISHNVNGVKFDTLYGHLSSMNIGVGDKVAAGQVIGTVGSTGNSTGSHLHYEVHVNGLQIDPAPFMATYAGSPG